MPTNRRNYYRLLHVQPDAPAEVVKAAYRALMSLHHPDKGGDAEKAILVNEAYAVLADPQRRVEYDRKRSIKPGRGANRDSKACGCPMCALPTPATLLRDARCLRCRAPLTSAGKAHGSTTAGERRKIMRVSKSDWARLLITWNGTPIDVRTRDLSLDGISVYSGALVPIGTTVRVEGAAFDVVAEIVSTRKMAKVFTLHAKLVTAHFVAQGGFIQRSA